jgi:hypothetical protein
LQGAVVGTVIALVSLVAGAAYAGTGIGGVFNLGQSNSVNGTTTLTGATTGPQLKVNNTSTGTGASGVSITTATGKPPLVVNSNTQVANFNASLLSGLKAGSQLQLRVTGTCPSGQAVTAVGGFGNVTCGGGIVGSPCTRGTIAGTIAESVDPITAAVALTCNVGLIPTHEDSATSSNTHAWVVVVPSVPYTTLHPTGTLSVTWNAGCPILTPTAALADSGQTSTAGGATNPTDFWGIDLGAPLSFLNTLGCDLASPNTTISYSGDATYQGF